MQSALLVLPGSDPTGIPVKCDLYNGLVGGLGNILGNILGLQSLGIIIVPVLLVVLVLVAIFGRARKAVLNAALILLAILVLGSLAVNLLPQFLPNACG
jgi:hypothetical protein